MQWPVRGLSAPCCSALPHQIWFLSSRWAVRVPRQWITHRSLYANGWFELPDNSQSGRFQWVQPKKKRSQFRVSIFPIRFIPVVEVSCGEYGMEYIDRMVSAAENGKCFRWTPLLAVQNILDESGDGEKSGVIEEFEEDIDPKQLKCRSTSWDQFKVLFNRRWKQMWRDSVIKLSFFFVLPCCKLGKGNGIV